MDITLPAFTHVWQHMGQCPGLCVTLCQPAFCLTCTDVLEMRVSHTCAFVTECICEAVSDLSTAGIWGWIVHCSGVTCTISLASTHLLPVTPLHVCQANTFLDIPCWVKSLWKHWVEGYVPMFPRVCYIACVCSGLFLCLVQGRGAFSCVQ